MIVLVLVPPFLFGPGHTGSPNQVCKSSADVCCCALLFFFFLSLFICFLFLVIIHYYVSYERRTVSPQGFQSFQRSSSLCYVSSELLHSFIRDARSTFIPFHLLFHKKPIVLSSFTVVPTAQTATFFFFFDDAISYDAHRIYIQRRRPLHYLTSL